MVNLKNDQQTKEENVRFDIKQNYHYGTLLIYIGNKVTHSERKKEIRERNSVGEYSHTNTFADKDIHTFKHTRTFTIKYTHVPI